MYINVQELIEKNESSYRLLQMAGGGENQSAFHKFDWQQHSICGKLVIPTSGIRTDEIERFKVEVGITLSNARRKM